jgi:hypothetical protein
VPVIDALAYAIIFGSLAVAAWCLVATLRDRPPGISQFAGIAVVELALLIQEAIATQRLVDGDRPDELATFIGYLIASLVILPLAGWLGWLERTKWGSAIVGFGCLVIPVLVLRLLRLWDGTVG